jgi:hypothetical protein
MFFQINNIFYIYFYIYFFKNNIIKYNYEIYYKEILIIIKYLKKQNIELRNIKEFQIRINYKNLKYFIIIKKFIK